MQEAYAIVCDAPKGGGRFWLGYNPIKKCGSWIFECFITKKMLDWEPVLWKTREAAVKALQRVKRPGSYIFQLPL